MVLTALVIINSVIAVFTFALIVRIYMKTTLIKKREYNIDIESKYILALIESMMYAVTVYLTEEKAKATEAEEYELAKEYSDIMMSMSQLIRNYEEDFENDGERGLIYRTDDKK